MVKRLAATISAVLTAMLIPVVLPGAAEAHIPCGRTNMVGPQGATVYRTASGFTPTGKHIPANTSFRDGQWKGDRVQALDWGGWVSVSTLRRVQGSTC